MVKPFLKKQAGFTIVELLIVVVVIAVLAAISIVAYTGIQNRAHDATVQSELRSIGQSLSVYQFDVGSYPTSTGTLDAVNIRAARSSYDTDASNFLYCQNSGTTYALIARSESGTIYYINNTNPAPRVAGFPVAGSSCTTAGVTSATAIWGYAFSTQTWATWVK